MDTIRLSVRRIVELALRGGDIDSRFSDSADAMLRGAQAHRMLQKQYDGTFRKEVSLSIQTQINNAEVVLQGRADGVSTGADGGILIDEIKTTTLPMDYIFSQSELHLGQAKCYAYILLHTLKKPPADITVQITYYQLDTGELQRKQWVFSREELDAFFADLLRKYGVWMRYERDWKLLRNETIHALDFPFDAYRRGQRTLAVSVYRAIENQKKLYVQAPTGIGKTLSTLFPSIKAMGEEKTEKLFYLTAKTVTRAVAEDAIRMMLGKGLRFKSVTLRAKEKICFQEETACNPDACPYAKGHYDRVNEALLDMLDENDLITPGIIEAYARKHRVCPHETALDAALWVDLVIGDYNHVFDPTVYLRRFFNDAAGNYTFLIDEAHNMVERVRSMYTASVRKSDYFLIKRHLKDKTAQAKKLRKVLGEINTHFIELRKKLEEEQKTAVSYEEQNLVLKDLIQQFSSAASEWMALEQYNGHELYPNVLELYFESMQFLLISELYDSRYCCICELFGGEVTVTYYCMDPSANIARCLERAKSTVFFSATLTPVDYYRAMLGGKEEDATLLLPSPFPRENLLLAAHSGITTKYKDREQSVRPIAEALYTVLRKKQGNHLVFFPSYEYMQTVYEQFCEDYPFVKTIIQSNGMDEYERKEFLERFDEENAETLLGFCVLGGIFSEGIDLKGERLVGSVIVGVGLPKISFRQNLIRDYFDRENGCGYDYAYVYPGMNKVLQAAGRVIRSEEDSGVVLLIDSRFGTQKYYNLYPRHWSHLKEIRTIKELENLL